MRFLLPDPGEGLLEAEITHWLVQPGDQVKVNDPLVEIETAKSLVELPSPISGTVGELLAAEGETVPVGTPIVVLAEESLPDALTAAGPEAEVERPAPPQDTPSSPTPGMAAPAASMPRTTDEEAPLLVGYGSAPASTVRRPRRSAADEAGAPGAEGRPATPLPPEATATGRGRAPAGAFGASELKAAPGGMSGVRPLAKPVVRRLARDLGVDLSAVAGSGPDGVITKEDVLGAREDVLGSRAIGRTFPAPPAGARVPDRLEPARGVRRTTAANLADSVTRHVHVTEWLSCDVTATMELIGRLRVRREFTGLRVSMLLMVARAVGLAISRHPLLNATWMPPDIGFHDELNLGIAAATPRGLMVPNIKSAQRLTLHDLALAMADLIARAKADDLRPEDLAEGTFTITNVGVFGVDAGTPIINGAESAILCLGAVSRRPWVVGSGDEERLEPRWVTQLAISFDHQLIDGEQGSAFLADVAGILSDPGTALLF